MCVEELVEACCQVRLAEWFLEVLKVTTVSRVEGAETGKSLDVENDVQNVQFVPWSGLDVSVEGVDFGVLLKPWVWKACTHHQPVSCCFPD